MDKDTLGLAILVAGALSATVAGLIRYGLLPYLREQLQQTREIHQQITQHPTGSAEPSTLREQVNELGGEIEDATLELRAMALMFDGHLDWAQREVDKLRSERQQAVDELWAELKRQRDAGRRSPHHRKDVTPE